VLVNEVFRHPEPQGLDAETMVADTVTVFLQGLEAK
jgi:hypothetical protein